MVDDLGLQLDGLRFVSPDSLVLRLYDALEKGQLIRDRLKTTYSRQKLYADNRIRDLEYEIVGHIYLKTTYKKGDEVCQ